MPSIPEVNFVDLPANVNDSVQSYASVFANPEDLRRYEEAIARGATHHEALQVGDNGIGYNGDNTASLTDPIVGLPESTPGFAYNRRVLIDGPKGQVVARIAETGAPKGRIDLNPAAAVAVGHPGGVVPVSWKYYDEPATMGLSKLTPIGSGEPETTLDPSTGMPDLSSTSMPDISIGDELPAAPEQSTYSDVSIPSPTKDTTVVEHTPQYTKFSNGVTYYANGSVSTELPNGRVAVKYGPGQKAIVIPPAAKQANDTPDTATYKAMDELNLSPVAGETKADAWTRIGEARKKQSLESGHVYDSLDPVGKKLAEAMSEYRAQTSQSARILSSKDPTGRKILAAAYELNPTLDANEYAGRNTYLKQWMGTQQGTVGGARDSLNRLIGHLSTLWNSAKELPAHDLTAANSVENFFRTKTGQPYAAKFNAKKQLVVNELERLVKQGVPTNFDVQQWDKNLNAAQSADQLDGVIRQAIPELVISPLDVMKDGYEMRMNKQIDRNKIIYPHTQKAIDNLGIKLDEESTSEKPSTPQTKFDMPSAIEAAKRIMADPNASPQAKDDAQKLLRGI